MGKERKRSVGKARGALLMIGGGEDKQGEQTILKEVVVRVGESGKLCIATIASPAGHEYWREYSKAFERLGLCDLSHLHVERRTGAVIEKGLEALDGANGVFFTGGDRFLLKERRPVHPSKRRAAA